ncbi:hypothetical protein RI367_002755 [Sorochytrium milnesiophthora]
MSISTVQTTPYDGQKPGTSGLRKRVKEFQQQNYTENFVSAIFSIVPDASKDGAKASLVVGGDGRYFLEDAVKKIIAIAVATKKVNHLIVGQRGILSTPAASNIIRKRNAVGGILLTASHNPGGPDNDFGIKYNVSNGGPAPESVTEKIYEYTKSISSYQIAKLPEIDLANIGTHTIAEGFTLEIIDSVNDYVALMKEIFDFDAIRSMLKARPNFTVLFDGMHGVTGPYAQRVFVKELGLPESSVMNCTPLPDFGGGHPDPNLTYAHDLVERVNKENVDFGAASDGDGDRNMIIGKNNTFVNPSDSVAVIAAWAKRAIPYFQKHGVHGVARSMPTSGALDRVAAKSGLQCYEVPTGWKFFGNLMDAGKLSICGEESFGTGSDHIREKDGLWAVMAWLSILATATNTGSNANVSLQDILNEHYATYGRNYFSRYDYEEVDAAPAAQMLDELRTLVSSSSFVGSRHGDGYQVAQADDFKYTDPVDNSVSAKQGVRIVFADGSRIIFRLSGTGSHGATVRLYVEKYEADPAKCTVDTQQAIKPLINIALAISKLVERTGRKSPTVIT